VADRRYRTAAWQRLRLQVLARDGYACRIQGPRCRGSANSVHHVLPSSTHPELFWDPSNLQAACGTCNSSVGAYLTADNRRVARERVADLEQENARLERIVEWQEARIEELALALAAQRNGPTGKPASNRARPAIR
jgi:5-methylcytosine-specific restriction endonuclease McrA